MASNTPQLNNPLRARAKPNSPNTSTDEQSVSCSSESSFDERPNRGGENESAPPQQAPKREAILDRNITKALDQLNASAELRKLLSQLSENGIELTAKTNYVKHSYEVEEELHKKFHEMYPVLGFKKVKDAVNDAFELWCKHYESEYRRRNSST